MEDVQFFLSPFHLLHLFQQFQAECDYKKSLEDACYFLLQSVTLVFYSFSLFQWKMSNFFSPFHSLHLFQQFQADCVYKKSLEDACYFLLQSVSLVFYSLSLFQLFQWKMSIFFKPVSFVTLVSAVSGRIVSIKNLLKMLVTSCYSLFY